MARRKPQGIRTNVDKLQVDSDERPSDTAGQSGDDQGISRISEANEESVDELVETDQAYEAEIVEGVEQAGDHPEEPVKSHEDPRNYKNPRLE